MSQGTGGSTIVIGGTGNGKTITTFKALDAVCTSTAGINLIHIDSIEDGYNASTDVAMQILEHLNRNVPKSDDYDQLIGSLRKEFDTDLNGICRACNHSKNSCQCDTFMPCMNVIYLSSCNNLLYQSYLHYCHDEIDNMDDKYYFDWGSILFELFQMAYSQNSNLILVLECTIKSLYKYFAMDVLPFWFKSSNDNNTILDKIISSPQILFDDYKKNEMSIIIISRIKAYFDDNECNQLFNLHCKANPKKKPFKVVYDVCNLVFESIGPNMHVATYFVSDLIKQQINYDRDSNISELGCITDQNFLNSLYFDGLTKFHNVMSEDEDEDYSSSENGSDNDQGHGNNDNEDDDSKLDTIDDSQMTPGQNNTNTNINTMLTNSTNTNTNENNNNNGYELDINFEIENSKFAHVQEIENELIGLFACNDYFDMGSSLENCIPTSKKNSHSRPLTQSFQHFWQHNRHIVDQSIDINCSTRNVKKIALKMETKYVENHAKKMNENNPKSHPLSIDKLSQNHTTPIKETLKQQTKTTQSAHGDNVNTTGNVDFMSLLSPLSNHDDRQINSEPTQTTETETQTETDTVTTVSSLKSGNDNANENSSDQPQTTHKQREPTVEQQASVAKTIAAGDGGDGDDDKDDENNNGGDGNSNSNSDKNSQSKRKKKSNKSNEKDQEDEKQGSTEEDDESEEESDSSSDNSSSDGDDSSDSGDSSDSSESQDSDVNERNPTGNTTNYNIRNYRSSFQSTDGAVIGSVVYCSGSVNADHSVHRGEEKQPKKGSKKKKQKKTKKKTKKKKSNK